ncbi:MAG: DUF58 domain-containing protein [Planctomycetota bacterium]
MPDIRPQDILDDDFLTKIERLRLISRKIIVGRIRGERLTRKRGQSVEFADYRRYVAGDDLRFVDWNLYARLDQLFLKLFLEEEDLHVYLLLDTSSSMGYGDPSKLHHARKVAAALAYIALNNYDRVVLAAFSSARLNTIGPLRGKHDVLRMLDFLAGLSADGPTDTAGAFKRFAVKHRRKGIVILISDFLDKAGFEAPLRFFLAANQDVFVLHTLAREEISPELVGDLKLLDIEDEDVAEVTVSGPLLKTYRRTVEGFVGALKNYAGSRGMNYLLAPTNVSFDVLVLDYLRRRGLLQ